MFLAWIFRLHFYSSHDRQDWQTLKNVNILMGKSLFLTILSFSRNSKIVNKVDFQDIFFSFDFGLKTQQNRSKHVLSIVSKSI